MSLEPIEDLKEVQQRANMWVQSNIQVEKQLATDVLYLIELYSKLFELYETLFHHHAITVGRLTHG